MTKRERERIKYAREADRADDNLKAALKSSDPTVRAHAERVQMELVTNMDGRARDILHAFWPC